MAKKKTKSVSVSRDLRKQLLEQVSSPDFIAQTIRDGNDPDPELAKSMLEGIIRDVENDIKINELDNFKKNMTGRKQGVSPKAAIKQKFMDDVRDNPKLLKDHSEPRLARMYKVTRTTIRSWKEDI